MRRTYRYDPSRPFGQRMVEITPQERVISHQVAGDIAPYRSMITGEMITGRRQHREHLRQHGCEEVGNEMPKPPPPPKVDQAQLRHDIRRAKDQLEAGMEPTLERLRQETPRVLNDLGLD